ncbi:MAG: M23 family metallopeptidase [Desulfovibrionaceae bacterium]|jgi:murein DD-endopeptidase MepM/ murein hydrolase activator NlpD|nr:M23 family metallopeptidase [Desulfovibrionaceae bacterium]
MTYRSILGLVVVFCLLAAVPARAEVSVSCPDTVSPGQPFLVRVSAPEGLAAVRLQWRDRTVEPPVRPAPGASSGDTKTAPATRADVLLGLGLDEKPGTLSLRVRATTAAGARVAVLRTLRVVPKQYPEERLTVKKGFVHLDEKALARHNKEKAMVHEAMEHLDAAPQWSCPFVRPVPGKVLSVFGMRRVFNGEPRSPHSGVDFRGAVGTSVHAAAAGRVLVADDLYFAGNCVYIDHGQGVVTVYAHLSRIDVRPGQEVAAGQVLGKVGATGRVTGPHLHFGAFVYGELVDPEVLLNPDCAAR